MKNKRIFLFAFLSLFLATSVGGQNIKDVRRYVKRGNKMIRAGQRDKAYEQYRKAFELDSTNVLVNYNLATSMFPSEWKIMPQDAKRDTAMMMLFQRAGDPRLQMNPIRQSMANHNLGVMHQIRANQSGEDQQKYQELQKAIEAYKQALRANPHDDEARYNLVLCQRQLPKGNGDGQQDQNGDQQQKQDKKDEQQQQQQQQQQQDQQQNQQPPQQEQNQEWIEQMLNAAEQREKQTRRHLDEQQQNQQNRRRQNEKNW